MVISAVEIHPFCYPLRAPLRLHGAELRQRAGFYFGLRADTGAVGWGECAPLPGFSRETLALAHAQADTLRRTLRGAAIPDEVAHLDGAFETWLGPGSLAPSLRFAVEQAALQCIARARGVTLGVLLGVTDTRLPLNALITNGEEDAGRRAQTLASEGWSAVKLKVGLRSIEEDAERTRLAASALGDITLRLDANRAWTYGDAMRFAGAIRGAAIEYIEEPLADPTDLALFAAESRLPVALDETVAHWGVECVARAPWAKAFVLKPTLLGGLERTARMARDAANQSKPAIISSAFETGLGLHGLAELAAHLGAAPAGLDTFSIFEHDILPRPPAVSRGALDLNDLRALLEPAYETLRYDRRL